MKTFTTKPGVKAFETGGPEGLVRVEAGKPLTTDDARVISVLSTHGSHALEISDGKPAAADRKHEGGEAS